MKQRVIEVCRQAEAYIAMRSFERAENLLREALIINPDFVPALIDVGGLNAEKGDFAKAEKYLTRAITLEPFNATAHYNLSMVYQMQGKMTEAENELKKFKEAEALSQKKETKPRQ